MRMIVALGLVAALQITRLRPPDVKFVGTPQNVVEAMLALAKVTPADVVYDLGSGDGRIPITAAKLAPAASASRSTRSICGWRGTTWSRPASATASRF